MAAHSAVSGRANEAALELDFGIDFPALYRRDGLVALDHAFLGFLGAADEALRARLLAGRADPEVLSAKDESALILEIAPIAGTGGRNV